MAIREVLTAPRSPWQSPYVERLIGSIRRECLNYIIVFNESSGGALSNRISIISTGRARTCRWRKMHGDQTGSTAGAGVGH
jgi:hypothetical protein